MILSTFYKQNHYHPIMALRSSFGLLIQIPFFMAAYSCLSNMQGLQGQAFLFIKDMGQQDAIISIGNFPINIKTIHLFIFVLFFNFTCKKNNRLNFLAKLWMINDILSVKFGIVSKKVVYLQKIKQDMDKKINYMKGKATELYGVISEKEKKIDIAKRRMSRDIRDLEQFKID